MSEQFHVKELAGGLTLLGQPMTNVSSSAIDLVVPAGASHDPPGRAGAAAVAGEWCFRGAGERDTRSLNDAFDALGCRHHESVRSIHVGISATQLGRNLGDVLAILADVLRRPRLGDDTFEPCRALTEQDLAAMEDEPARKCNIMLREKFYPPPLGNCIFGTQEDLRALTPQAVREHTLARLTPAGSILAVAGSVDWQELCDVVEACFGDWSAPPPPPVETRDPAGGVTHVHKDSAQTHITLAHRAVPAGGGQYCAARLAEAVLSAGMSSRLFTEVREKRGLVYHVSSRYHSLKDVAGMFTYAGTVPDKAQETFDVTVGELRRLADGIEAEELARAKTQLKSSLVMQGESTAARAAALSGDWYHLGRLRSLRELADAIDNVTVEQVLAYLNDFPARDFTVLVIGPEPVDTGAAED